MTHTHHKWPCPKSNGRHEWEFDRKRIEEWNLFEDFLKLEPDEIGFPVRCKFGCGAFGTEWYKFEELIEGE